MRQHQQQAHVAEKYQRDRKAHEPVVRRRHRKLEHISLALRELARLCIEPAHKPVEEKQCETQHKRDEKRQQHLSCSFHAPYVVHNQARVCKIYYQLVDAVIHLVVDEVYLSQKPPCEQDGKKYNISSVHLYCSWCCQKFQL